MGVGTFFHLSSTVLTFRVDMATMLGLHELLHCCVRRAGSSGLPRMHALCVMLCVCTPLMNGLSCCMPMGIARCRGICTVRRVGSLLRCVV